jgi:hypothetical protein
MNVKVNVTTTVMIDLSVATAAQWFSGLTDDEMCKFFVAVAELSKGWQPDGADRMWYFTGKHLAECECSTYEAQEMLRSIVRSMEQAISAGSL